MYYTCTKLYHKLQQGRKNLYMYHNLEQGEKHGWHMYKVVPHVQVWTHMCYIVPCTLYHYHYTTLPSQRHGNPAVESVVSPSQIICRGGHTHLGYVTAKSCKERRKRWISLIYSYSKRLSKMHMLQTCFDGKNCDFSYRWSLEIMLVQEVEPALVFIIVLVLVEVLQQKYCKVF